MERPTPALHLSRITLDLRQLRAEPHTCIDSIRVRFSHKHYHSNGQCLEALLKRNVLVRREDDIEGGSGLLQKDSVPEAPPTDLGNGSGFMACE